MILYDSTLITPTTGLMIWTLVTFVIVLIVLRKFAFGPIQQLIDARRQAIVADLDAAQAAREEAQTSLAEYRQQLAEARKEANKIVEDARRVGDERRAAAVAELEAEKTRLMQQTREEIQSETRQALNAIKQQVADLTLAATEKVVRAQLNEAEQRRLIDEALADVDLSTLVPPTPAVGAPEWPTGSIPRRACMRTPCTRRRRTPARCRRSTATWPASWTRWARTRPCSARWSIPRCRARPSAAF